jgi:hypothetical protein
VVVARRQAREQVEGAAQRLGARIVGVAPDLGAAGDACTRIGIVDERQVHVILAGLLQQSGMKGHAQDTILRAILIASEH